MSNLGNNNIPLAINKFTDVKHFPAIIDGTIDTQQFLDAAVDLISIVENISKVFAPVKHDMEGNIHKIKTYFETDKSKNSTIFQLIQNEQSHKENLATDALLWLNRAILFFELVFDQLLKRIQSNTCDENMKNIFTIAYEGSVKNYHGWMTQQLFFVICKMCPSLPSILKSFGADADMKKFEFDLQEMFGSLQRNRTAIDNYYKEHHLCGL